MASALSGFQNKAEEEEKVYVAVGEGVIESTLTLWWAIQRFSPRNFCLLHLHRPSVQGQHRDMSNELDEYVLICNQSGIQAEKLYLEIESVEKGILELISRCKIQNLVMGATAGQNYHVKMLAPNSSKAICVKSHAPSYCHIWFICRGHLVCTREARFESPSSVNTQQNQQITMTAQANMLESICREEPRKKMEIEAELELLKNQHNETLAEAAEQKLAITNYEMTVKQWKDKVKLYEEERDEAREVAIFMLGPLFLPLPPSEILTATSESDQSSQLLSEGEHGNIYKAFIYHTEVTLRFLHDDELLEFGKEVEILGKFRHPNLATLVGFSPDTQALVYENFPNGSLEDRLRCKDDTRPLSWQTRIKIAAELCSALIFLHSHGVIHGALRPSCVFLDSNFSCKIIDFQSSHINGNSSTTTSVYIGEYTDPEFLDATAPYPEMDIYSFGLILIELLTGRPGFCVVEQVRSGLDEGTLDSLLDTSAGDWPILLAEQLAHLGLRCCDSESFRRPDLKSVVWKVLEPIRLSSCHAFPFRVGEAPSYFVCPITQKVLEDPQIAADGYTYEAEALNKWIDRGNETSPMTHLPLAHTRLAPNRALRSAIQAWIQGTSKGDK